MVTEPIRGTKKTTAHAGKVYADFAVNVTRAAVSVTTFLNDVAGSTDKRNLINYSMNVRPFETRMFETRPF